MDPASAVELASTVIDLAEFAFKIFSKLHKYYRNVKAAPAKAAELREEFQRVLDVVSGLQEYLESRPHALSPTILEHIELFRFVTLEEMWSAIQPQQVHGLRRLKWPFQERQNMEYLTKFRSFRDHIDFALGAANTSAIFLFQLGSWLDMALVALPKLWTVCNKLSPRFAIFR
jgi:hypothetical protein